MPVRDSTAAAWTLTFAQPDRLGGFVRVVRWPDGGWFWAYLVSPAIGLVVVRDHDLPPPRGRSPVVRADGLWAELTEETPDEHWSVGLEAFGVRLDDPLDAERGERGERLPAGLDVEWETGAGIYGAVRGVLLAGAARQQVDATGVLVHESFDDDPSADDSRRCTWQRDPSHGSTARGGAVALDSDADALPSEVRADGVTFAVAATAVVPTARRAVLSLVDAPAGRGWLEWWQGIEEPGRTASR